MPNDRHNGTPQARLGRPTIGELQSVLFGLQGIFWALNMLSNHEAASDTEGEFEIQNGIANLIVAGECLTNEVTRRF